MITMIILLFGSAGVNSLLLPASPNGVLTSFSITHGEEAIFYNPANFSAGENFRLWCFYNRHYLSMSSVSMVMGRKIGKVDLGLAIDNFDYGDMEWHPDYPTEDPLISYSAHDLSIILGSGISISQQGRIGFSLKWIYENVYTYNDYVFAFDLSFSYQNDDGGLSFGTTNFGSKINLKNDNVNLPTRISLGGFRKFKGITASFDMHYLINNGVFEFGVGMGFPLHRMLTVNGAVNYRESFYPGIGITLNPGAMTIKYAASIYPKDLGMINILGIGFNF